jgi:hypothetical protein
MRSSRIALMTQLAIMLIGVAVIVYVLGFSVHPHRLGLAWVVAACYVVVTGGLALFIYRARRAAAKSQSAGS